jgi:hypothetical protein
MSKKKPAPRKSRTKPEPSTLEHFRSFLAAADRQALEILVSDGGGLLPNPGDDGQAYRNALDDLANKFCRPYDTTEADDVIHFTEHDAKLEAAHMIGLALGLRLRGLDLGLTSGGAR